MLIVEKLPGTGEINRYAYSTTRTGSLLVCKATDGSSEAMAMAHAFIAQYKRGEAGKYRGKQPEKGDLGSPLTNIADFGDIDGT